MSQTSFQKPRLAKPRNSKLVMHVCRNSLSLLEVMHRLYFQGLSMDSCRKAVKELVKQGYLNQYELWGNKQLYRIGQRSVSAFGWPKKRANRPGPQRLPYLLGALQYTCMQETVRKQLIPTELQKKFPWFPAELINPWAYTLLDDGLATIRVQPRCGRPDRIIQKLLQQLYQYCATEELQDLHDRGKFTFVVVVASDAQANVLRKANESEGNALTLVTAVYPDLVRFM